MGTWTEEDETTARRIVSMLLDAVATLSHEDGSQVATLDLWLTGTPAKRLALALDNAVDWQDAYDLMLRTGGCRCFKGSPSHWPAPPKRNGRLSVARPRLGRSPSADRDRAPLARRWTV